MNDVDTQLALIVQKLDTIGAAQEMLRTDVRTLHSEHAKLQLGVAAIPMATLKEHEGRFAPLGRFKLVERMFYGLLTAVVLAVLGAVISDMTDRDTRSLPRVAASTIREK